MNARFEENRGEEQPGLRLNVVAENSDQLAARARALGLATSILHNSEVNVRGYHAHELANLVLDLLGGESVHSGVEVVESRPTLPKPEPTPKEQRAMLAGFLHDTMKAGQAIEMLAEHLGCPDIERTGRLISGRLVDDARALREHRARLGEV